MTDNLIPAVSFQFVAAAIYAFIGIRLGLKTFSQADDKKAWRMFRIWWFGQAFSAALNGVASLLLAAGVQDLNFHVVLTVVRTLSSAAALWGLLSYLLYVFRGSTRASVWLGVFYALFALMLFYSFFAFQPTGVHMGDWETVIDYAAVPTGAFALTYVVSLLLLISLPPVLAAIGFFALAFRIKERSPKYRAFVVPTGIMILFGLPYLVPLALYPFGVRFETVEWWPLTIRLIGIFALLLIYWGYFPPTVVQKRLRVSPVTS